MQHRYHARQIKFHIVKRLLFAVLPLFQYSCGCRLNQWKNMLPGSSDCRRIAEGVTPVTAQVQELLA